MTGTAGQLRVPASYLSGVSFPLAPLAEQQRIVEAIEERFSHIDAGVSLLKAARRKLKLYRASVLKAAVEGALTEQWRAAHPDIEPAPQLLWRDKTNLDIFWLRDESLESVESLPPPDVLAKGIIEDLEAALEQFRAAAGYEDANGANGGQ